MMAFHPQVAWAQDKVKAKVKSGTLTVTGTSADETLALRLRAGDPTMLEIDLGDDGSAELDFKREKFDHIVVQAGNGDDTVRIDEVNGAFTDTEITTVSGGAGEDALIGGTGAETFFGGPGNDAIMGGAGGDLLRGGDDADVLTGGDGDDLVFGEAGNDRLIWNPGDDSDLDEGGDGIDTVEVNGGNGSEAFTVAANGARVRLDRVSPAPFTLDIGTSENLVVNLNGGDDTISATGNLAALIQITADGGAGNDTIGGSNGADVLLGGDGNDLIDGQQGNDVAFMGAGDDVFKWDPGDGSDTLEGEAGTDTMLFNGSNVSEHVDVSANGRRVRLFRDVASVTMDLNDVEVVDVYALGGADTIVVNDLSGTDVTEVNADLAAVGGGGDGQADDVVVNATNGDDVVSVSGDASGVSVLGLAATVNITGAEAANDRLAINALAGDDVVDGSSLTADAIQFAADGGDGSDVLLGGDGADVLVGGNGDDVLIGGAGLDALDGGPGDNIVIQ